MLTSASELSQDFIMVSKQTHHSPSPLSFRRLSCSSHVRYSSYKGILKRFGVSRIWCSGEPGQRGLITSRQGSRRGFVVQHAEGGINSSLIATEGGFGVIHILVPLPRLPPRSPWIEIYLKRAHRRTYPGGLLQWGVSLTPRVNRENGAQVALAAALESSARKIKPSSIMSRLDDHALFITHDESWERARLRAETSSNFSHEATPHVHSPRLSYEIAVPRESQ